MSGIAYRSLIGEADRWLEQAVDDLRGGKEPDKAAAEAAIASAYYARAALEKPDTLESLMTAAQAAKAQAPAQAPDNTDELDAAVARHPAGSKRVADEPAPRVIRDIPQA